MKQYWLYACLGAIAFHSTLAAICWYAKDDKKNNAHAIAIPLVWDHEIHKNHGVKQDLETNVDHISPPVEAPLQQKTVISVQQTHPQKISHKTKDWREHSKSWKDTPNKSLNQKKEVHVDDVGQSKNELSPPSKQSGGNSFASSFYPDPKNPLPIYPKEKKSPAYQAYFRLFLTPLGTVEHVQSLTQGLSVSVEKACHAALLMWRFHGQMPPFVDVPIVFQERR